jgi:hypothetical protein
METLMYFTVIKWIAISAGVIGLIAGLDLLLGVRLFKTAKVAMNKVVDFDRVVIKTASALRARLDRKAGEIDGIIMNTKARVILGALFVILSAVILMLVRIYK